MPASRDGPRWPKAIWKGEGKERGGGAGGGGEQEDEEKETKERREGKKKKVHRGDDGGAAAAVGVGWGGGQFYSNHWGRGTVRWRKTQAPRADGPAGCSVP